MWHLKDNFPSAQGYHDRFSAPLTHFHFIRFGWWHRMQCWASLNNIEVQIDMNLVARRYDRLGQLFRTVVWCKIWSHFVDPTQSAGWKNRATIAKWRNCALCIVKFAPSFNMQTGHVWLASRFPEDRLMCVAAVHTEPYWTQSAVSLTPL